VRVCTACRSNHSWSDVAVSRAGAARIPRRRINGPLDEPAVSVSGQVLLSTATRVLSPGQVNLPRDHMLRDHSAPSTYASTARGRQRLLFHFHAHFGYQRASALRR
jgi:hypothetical protein